MNETRISVTAFIEPYQIFNTQNLIQALSEKQSDKIEIDLAPNLIKIDQNCHCAGACGGGDLGGGVLIRPGQASAVPLSLPPNERAAWLAHSPLLAQMRGRLLEDYSRPFSQPSPLSSLHTGGQHLRCQGWGKPGWGIRIRSSGYYASWHM